MGRISSVERARVEALIKAASLALEEGRWWVAERHLNTVLRIEPGHREAKELLGRLYSPRRPDKADSILPDWWKLGFFGLEMAFVLMAILVVGWLWMVSPVPAYEEPAKELQAAIPASMPQAVAYAEGMAALNRGRLEEAAHRLEEVIEGDPHYAGALDKLASIYYELGRREVIDGNLSQARFYFRKALALKPDWDAPGQALEELFPPTPTPTPMPTPTPVPSSDKRIEVIISQQRLHAWEGGKLLYNFPCSTGAPGSPTRPGSYRVISKIPMAYSYTWNLKMPYWLGIYWVGNLENGIHALPILANGETLWEGYLGTPVSFGCIILGTEEARMLYEWAEIGTPVIIKP